MSEAIYEWMKNLAVFYIFLTAVTNLLPDSRYEAYVRFFMGLVLLLLIVSPVLELLDLREQIPALFEQKLQEEESLQSKWEKFEQSQQGKQSAYLLQEYEASIEQAITARYTQKGYPVTKVSVSLAEGEILTVEAIEVHLAKVYDPEMEKEVTSGLEDTYQTAEERIHIFFADAG